MWGFLGMHSIDFVNDDVLPEGHDFLFVAAPEGGALIYYRESALSPTSLEHSWAAYRASAASRSPDPGTPSDETPERPAWLSLVAG